MKTGKAMVGAWEVHAATNQLRRGYAVKALEPLTMDVLLLLIEHAGEVVSTETIIASVWRGHVVADNPVYKHIAKLRNAFEDDTRNPTYIQTVSKRGYRLIATVRAIDRDEATASSGVRRRFGTVAITAVVVVIAMVGFNLIPRSSAMVLRDIREVAPLPGVHQSASFSKDGRHLAIALERGGREEVWLIPRLGGDAINLTGDLGNCGAPVWSQVENAVAFHCDSDIWAWRDPPHGDLARLVTNGQHPDWSPDGGKIVFERGSEVWERDLGAARERRLHAVANDVYLFAPRTPRYSPDGDWILFAETTDGPLGDLWRLHADTGQLLQVSHGSAVVGAASWRPDGAVAVFGSRREGAQLLWQLPISGGGPATALTRGFGDDSAPVISPRGDRIAWINERHAFALMLTDPAEDDAANVVFESRFPVFAPSISPEGDVAVFFGGGRTGALHIFATDLTPGAPRQLTAGPGVNHSMPHWAADGRSVYHYRSGADGQGFHRTPISGGPGVPVLTEVTFNREHDIRVAPSGETAIYAALTEARVRDTRIVDLADGSERSFPRRISWIEWSKDGERLLATDFTSTNLPVGEIVHCKRTGSCETIAPRGQHPCSSHDEQSAL